MAYTNAWTNVLPLGSQQAHTADDEFRKLRLDIFERMNSLVLDWAADPVVLRPDALESQLPTPLSGPQTLSLGPADFRTIAGVPVYSINALNLNSGADEVFAPVHILPGCIITHINATVLTLTSLKFTLYRVSTTGAVEVTTWNSAAQPDLQNPVSSPVINHTVLFNSAYFLHIETLGSQQCAVHHIDFQYRFV